MPYVMIPAFPPSHQPLPVTPDSQLALPIQPIPCKPGERGGEGPPQRLLPRDERGAQTRSLSISLLAQWSLWDTVWGLPGRNISPF